MRKRNVRFGCDGRDVVFAIDVVVCGPDEPAAEPRITTEQFAHYRELEREHGGAVPVTPEEYDALSAGDVDRLAALAAEPGSNLRPLLQGSAGGDP